MKYNENRSFWYCWIAGGECEYTRYGFRNLINLRAVDILQPDLCAAGGFSEMMKITAMASAANIPLVEEAGGKVLGEPMEIPGVGLYVAFFDTEGNRVSMLQPYMWTKGVCFRIRLAWTLALH